MAVIAAPSWDCPSTTSNCFGFHTVPPPLHQAGIGGLSGRLQGVPGWGWWDVRRLVRVGGCWGDP